MLRLRRSPLLYIFVLYSFQGILYGLQVKFLPVILRTRGRSLIFIGSLNLLSLPWMINTVWAPFIDLYWTTSTWLRLTIAGICTSLLLLYLTQYNQLLFAIVLLILNMFSSCQELVIGKISLSELNQRQLKKVSSVKVLAYKTGIMIGGGGTLWIASTLSLTKQVFLLVAVCFIFLFLLLGEYSQPIVSRDNHVVKEEVRRYPVLQIYDSISRGSKWLITCLLVYKYSSHSCQMLFTMILVDQGIGADVIGLMSGVVGQTVSLSVALIVGIILSKNRVSAIQVLYSTALLNILSAAGQVWFLFQNKTSAQSFVLLLFVVQNVVLGAQTTPVYALIITYASKHKQPLQATQYSIYTTIETIGSKLSLFLTGLLTEYLGYTITYVISFMVAVLFVVIMVCQPIDQRPKQN